jgi:hypothetical protein
MVLRVPFKPFHFNSLIRIMMLDLKDYSQWACDEIHHK